MKNIRNFAIIAHIDHGKSTLADRLLEITQTVKKEELRPQYLDMMDLERERGITIKMQPVRMKWKLPENLKKIFNFEFSILNLIDTPGHVDFSYEVSRSLAAIEGAILLVDATKGVQAQTIANLEMAKKQGLKIIPCVNKIDLPQAQVENTILEIYEILGIEEEVLTISAKLGTNVDKLLERIVREIPPPKGQKEKPLRALIFDSKYDPFYGVIAYVRIFDGAVQKGEELFLIQKKVRAQAKEVGYFLPQMEKANKLEAGEIGWIALGIKEPGIVRIGDTISLFAKDKILVKPLPGYQEPKPTVFMSIYPKNPNDFLPLKDALEKLKLNDASLYFEGETRAFLGRGFKCGFLGLLHAEIICERIKREFGIDIAISSPSVAYKIKTKKGEEIIVSSAKDWPNEAEIEEVKEQYVLVKIITPTEYFQNIMKFLKEKDTKVESFGEGKILIELEMPLRELIVGFYDKIKSLSRGFASLDYKLLDWRKADLVKLEILIAGKVEEALSQIVPRDKAYQIAKETLDKLYKIFPPQLFEVPLQGRVRGRIIARRTVKAKRRDVLAPLYGGDVTRKMKLLERQKRGKKKLKEKGQLSLSPEIFWKMFQ